MTNVLATRTLTKEIGPVRGVFGIQPECKLPLLDKQGNNFEFTVTLLSPILSSQQNYLIQHENHLAECVPIRSATEDARETASKMAAVLNRGVQPEVINVAGQEANDLPSVATPGRLLTEPRRRRRLHFIHT
ncbi:hypothetical protein PoB_007438800 [Plakobranchus ocellatus]|uniref:Uncharacterized protein n=1 Tax=Plakobranchus ocellatus TaxID=259542 RepID=A0AAV4DUC7_9GAST|nr:hypothetical protein PoB_007438800 [Plakobranchus ocellatus]